MAATARMCFTFLFIPATARPHLHLSANPALPAHQSPNFLPTPKTFTEMTNKSLEKPRLCPPLPWKTRLFISVLSAVTDAASRPDFTINRRLLRFIDRRVSASAKPLNGARTADITVDPARNLWFRLYVPETTAGRRFPVVVIFHGGGFAYLSPKNFTYDAFCRRICRKIQAAVVSVDYRLSPEHRYPAQYDDGIDVLRFLDDNGCNKTLDGINCAPDALDLSSCFLAGDSAGGNISHHVGRRWAAAKDWKRVRVAGLVLIQPFFGGEQRTGSELRLEGAPLVSLKRTDWLWRAFLPEGSDRDHAAVNVFGPRDEAELEEGFPAALVVVGGYDPLQDWQRGYYEGLKTRGKEAKLVEYPDAIHAFYVFPELKESGQLIEVIGEFVEEKRAKA